MSFPAERDVSVPGMREPVQVALELPISLAERAQSAVDQVVQSGLQWPGEVESMPRRLLAHVRKL